MVTRKHIVATRSTTSAARIRYTTTRPAGDIATTRATTTTGRNIDPSCNGLLEE